MPDDIWVVLQICTLSVKSATPPDNLIQSKTRTHAIERNHCRQRHWFGRFKRRSIIVSKSNEFIPIKPYPTLAQCLIRHVLLSRELLAARFLGGHENLDLGEREGEEAEIL